MTTSSRPSASGFRKAALVGVVAALGVGLVATPAFAKPPKPHPVPTDDGTVVAFGLNNPRGIAIRSHNRLWVAEGGTGGTECTSDVSHVCFGLTGSLTLIKDADKNGKKKKSSTVQRIVTGLLSVSSNGGAEVVGLDGLTMRGDHEVYGVMAESTDDLSAELLKVTSPSAELTAAVTDYAGRLVRFRRLEPTKKKKTELSVVANVGTFNWAWTGTNSSLDPGGQFPDANPYDVAASGNRQWVVDAGANTVVEVRKHKGTIEQRVLAYIPNTPLSDAVPTCIARKGNYLYVGTLAFADNFGGGTPVS